MRARYQRRSATAAAATTLIATLGAAVVSGCLGGGGDDDPPAAQATLLKGVIATGAPLAGATVSVSDGDPATTDPAAVTAAADGSYSVDISALKGALVVHAQGQIDGLATELVAVVPAVTAASDNTANVTPLTNAVAALIAPGGDPLALRTPATLSAAVTAQKVNDATALVVNTLATDSTIAAALGSGFNPLTTAFAANGSGIDGVLDKLMIEIKADGVVITNLAAPVADGTQAGVVLTPAATSTPNQVPTLPPSAGDLPSAAELATLAADMQACLALPLATRATKDGAGTVIALDERCQNDLPDWRSNGRNWLEDVGQFLVGSALMSNAKAGKPLIIFTAAAPNHSDPKVFKHPYCNAATCVVVRIPFTAEGGQVVPTDWVMAKVQGEWKLVGNQRPYNTFVQPRMNRKIGVYRDAPTPTYFNTDRYESVLRLIFDLRHGDTSGIRAVRFSGPGLPAAGVVSYRSQRCAADDRMGIVNQVGSTRLRTSSDFQFWTNGAGTEFVLDAAKLDGTPLTMPTPDLSTWAAPDFSPQPLANQSTAVPPWSTFKIEIFRFAQLSDEPDEILYIRSGTGAENASAGPGKPWPTLDAGFIDNYLKPGGGQAGLIDTLAHSMSFTMPAGAYAASAYLFGQNSAQATNAQNESANYGFRGRLDFLPAQYGQTTMGGSDFATAASGTSLSPSTANALSNPNPRCGPREVVPLTENTSDYREAGIGFRDKDRKFYNAIWFWDN
jgi:hypothetical protein